MLRIVLALIALLAAFVAGVVIAVLGAPGHLGLLLAFGCLIAGFASLRISRRPDVPGIPLRMTVAVSSVIVVAMMFGLSWPPSRAELAPWLVLPGTIALAVVSAVVHRRSAGLAVLLLALPAVNSARILLVLAQSFQAGGGAEVMGPSVTLAGFVTAAMAVGLLVAPWHAWADRVRAENTVPAS